jgi:ketosteroid isomerase-like protein
MKHSLPLLALATLLGACSSNASTPPAEATTSTTASTMASTTIGEQFMEALMKRDSARVRTLLADDVVVLGATPKQQLNGKNLVATAFSKGKVSNFQSTPLAKSGDANMVYYAGFYSQDKLPSAKNKQGGIDAGSYLMIVRKDSENDWKVSYLHISSSPLQVKK